MGNIIEVAHAATRPQVISVAPVVGSPYGADCKAWKRFWDSKEGLRC